VVRADVTLGPDGLGPYSFGSGQAVIQPWLTEMLGPPDAVDSGGYPTIHTDAQSQFGEEYSVGNLLSWPTAGLVVAFAERVRSDGAASESVMLAWTVSLDPWYPGQIANPNATPTGAAIHPSIRLVTGEGIGLGSTGGELETVLPSTVFYAWNDSTAVPNGFHVPRDDGGPSMQGDLDWDVVRDVQRALNAAGADLVVDGIAGPLTRAALAGYSDGLGLATWVDAFTALGLSRPPSDSLVSRLSAGWWFWELECGPLEPLGLTVC